MSKILAQFNQTKKFNKLSLLPIISILVSSFAFMLGNPSGSSPDELVHNAASWYTFENGLPTRISRTMSNPLPQSLVLDNECYKFKREQDAFCLPERTNEIVEGYPMMTYAPIYYFVVGAGQHLGAIFANKYAAIGGRIFSLLFNLLIISIALKVIYKINPFTYFTFPIILTPMALFLFPRFNPSGGEIATGLLFTAYLYHILDKYDGSGFSLQKTEIIKGSLFASLFLLSRPSAMVWSLVIFAILALNSKLLKVKKNTLFIARKICFLPYLVALLFHLTHPHQTGSPGTYKPLEEPSIRFYVDGFITSIENFPKRMWETYGVLGWLDTPSPIFIVIIFYTMSALWIFRIAERIRINRLQIALILFSIWPLISFLEMLAWNAWPNWWQGRYSLPLISSIMLIFLLSAKFEYDKNILRVEGIAIIFVGIVSLLNAFRYNFGLQGLAPRRLSNPALGNFRFEMSLITFTVLVIIGIYLLIISEKTLNKKFNSKRKTI